jgi:hypothetical protein
VGEQYWLVRFLLQRGLALIYLLAFLVAATQFRPLAGEDGLLPLGSYVERTSVAERPSLFQFVPDDRAIGVAAWTGVGLALVAVVAGPYWLPDPYAVPVSNLLKTGFLAIFLGAGTSEPPVVVIWLVKWVLFRNTFGAGLIKIRGDDMGRLGRTVRGYARRARGIERFVRVVVGGGVALVAGVWVVALPSPRSSPRLLGAALVLVGVGGLAAGIRNGLDR